MRPLSQSRAALVQRAARVLAIWIVPPRRPAHHVALLVRHELPWAGVGIGREMVVLIVGDVVFDHCRGKATKRIGTPLAEDAVKAAVLSWRAGRADVRGVEAESFRLTSTFCVFQRQSL